MKYAARGKTSFWDFIWLKAELKDIFTSVSCVDEEAISQLPEAIEYKEFESFLTIINNININRLYELVKQ